VITTITGTVFHIAVALDKFLIAFGNNFRVVLSTQNQITLIACFPLSNDGSNPTVSIILKGMSSLSYNSSLSVVPEVPYPVFAFSTPSGYIGLKEPLRRT
jgi:hypothetical protein